jgi:hypothetical protein
MRWDTSVRNELFIALLSWKLKWAFLVVRRPSVRLVSDVSLLHFYIFDFFSRTAGPIVTKVGTNHLWWKGFRIVHMKGNPFLYARRKTGRIMLWCCPSVRPSVRGHLVFRTFFLHLCSYRIETWVIAL